MNIQHELQERLASDRRKQVSQCVERLMNDRRRHQRRARDRDNAFVNEVSDRWYYAHHKGNFS